MPLNNPVLLGIIGGSHGIKGEVRVKSFTDDPLAFGDYGSLRSTDGRKFKVMRLRTQKHMLVVKFKGYNFRDEAETLNGTELFVDRSELPDDTEEDEFYVTDMIGMSVKDTEGAPIGTLIAVPDFGAGNLLEISGRSPTSSKSWFLEFTKENVPDMNFETREITVRVPVEVSERDENPEA